MRRLILIGTVILAAFLAGRFSWQASVSAKGNGAWKEAAASCGDLNTDGAVDVSDAVYLLFCLFLDGPCPECPPPGRSELPATGQTICYDDDGRPIDCGHADFPGQDGAYEKGCPGEDRFEGHGDSTVSDACTGLVWQQDTADTNGDGRITGQDMVPWQEALRYCESLILSSDGTWTTELEVAEAHGGVLHDDWRLPNIRELTSLADYGSTVGLDPIFSGRDTACHWSSTTVQPLPRNAWTVGFVPGCPVVDKSGLYYVRAVRSE